jgi:NhaP-type Na+/H+ or K+/H+ antiporter
MKLTLGLAAAGLCLALSGATADQALRLDERALDNVTAGVCVGTAAVCASYGFAPGIGVVGIGAVIIPGAGIVGAGCAFQGTQCSSSSSSASAGTSPYVPPSIPTGSVQPVPPNIP